MVIGTTNTENLNAHANFSCPSAAQRRFPAIVIPTVKEEFRGASNTLDSSKITTVGEYPDYWDWTVKLVKPQCGSKRTYLAETEIILDKAPLVDFLVWFNKSIDNHNRILSKISTSTEVLKNSELCTCCKLPSTLCLVPQSGYTGFVSFLEYLYYTLSITNLICILCVKYSFFRSILSIYEFFLGRFVRCRNYFDHIRGRVILQRDYWTSLSKGLLHNTCYPEIFLAITLLMGAGSIFSKIIRKKYTVQGSGLSKNSRKPDEASEERYNPWYKDDYVLSDLALTPQITSSLVMDFNQFCRKIANNTVYAEIIRDGVAFREFRAFCVKGNIYVTNNHNILFAKEHVFKIVNSENKDGISTNVTITIKETELFRLVEEDLCYFVVSNLPPKCDLSNYLVSEPIRCKGNGRIVSANPDGQRGTIDFHCLEYQPKVGGILGSDPENYLGSTIVRTAEGLCGSPYCMITAKGFVILGLHTYGPGAHIPIQSSYHVGCNILTPELLIKSGIAYTMQSSNSALLPLSSKTAKRELSGLHRKSPFRYFCKGVANVYGSFVGFRPKPKSRVCLTPMNTFLSEEGYKTNFTAPVMSGWVPWRHALEEMTKPHEYVDVALVAKARSMFVSDILVQLDEEIKTVVHPYDEFTAINGAAGITYVDKINRNTSAGNPWKKSKKWFMSSLPPVGDLLDPVEVNAEIRERVELLETAYRTGTRMYPCFCAHLKDEPVSFAKREIGKTRVFAGAPVDYSIVVRKYLLSVIRLIQSHNLLFESGPGTIAQSKEWNDLREFLTTFGDESIVAGDYKYFDKHMHPVFMKEAFNIIRIICEHSGNYDEEDLKVIESICMDTTYPLMDFNGDLCEFIGVNPSGHPLTVIINGLVNSLYIRYSYLVSNPKKEVPDFRENVKLMTYGDDNVMGVNPAISWFNHTTIQNALSQFGVTYTMADKVSESVPFIHIDNASFLKRTWRFDPDLEFYVCPLEHTSIEKSLMVWSRSKSICSEEQCTAVIHSAIREYFWYGMSVFKQKREMFKKLIVQLDIELWFEDLPLPTWSQLKSEYYKASKLGDDYVETKQSIVE